MKPAGEPRRLSNYGEGADLLVALIDAISSARTRVWVKVPWWDASPAARLRTVVQAVMEETDAVGRTREAPSVVFDQTADMLLARERSILADLVVIGRPPRGTPALWAPRTDSRTLLANALADVLVLPAMEPDPLPAIAMPAMAPADAPQGSR